MLPEEEVLATDLAALVMTVDGHDTVEHVHGRLNDLLLNCAAVEGLLHHQTPPSRSPW